MSSLDPKYGQCECKPFSRDLYKCDNCVTVYCGKCIDTRIRKKIENKEYTQMIRCCPKCVSTEVYECSTTSENLIKQARELNRGEY